MERGAHGEIASALSAVAAARTLLARQHAASMTTLDAIEMHIARLPSAPSLLDVAATPLSPEDDLHPIRLHLTGQTEERGASNLVRSRGAQVWPTDAPFIRLLRLVVAMGETEGGFVDEEEFVLVARPSTGKAFDTSAIDRAAYHVRQPFLPVLGTVPKGDFIQIRRRRVRLLPDAHVTWDRDQLLQHPNEAVQVLALRLSGTARDDDDAHRAEP